MQASPVELRNRHHLIQLLNALDRDALDGKGNELWFQDEGGARHTVHASVTSARSVNVRHNGARSSRQKILTAAGY